MSNDDLIKTLRDLFPTKTDHQELRSEITGLRTDHQELRVEITGLRKEMNQRFSDVDESLGELKASAKALDHVLEKHPIERLTRLEDHLHLPSYEAVIAEE